MCICATVHIQAARASLFFKAALSEPTSVACQTGTCSSSVPAHSCWRLVGSSGAGPPHKAAAGPASPSQPAPPPSKSANASTRYTGRSPGVPRFDSPPIGPSAAQALMEWVRLHAESVTGRMGYAAGYKKDIDLEMLDPTGVVVEKWILYGTFLTDVNFGALSYSQDALADITASLRMDRCVLVY